MDRHGVWSVRRDSKHEQATLVILRMGARLGLLLVALLAALQPSHLVGAQSLDDVMAHGRQLTRRGDYDQAREFYGLAAERLNHADATAARLAQAQAALADG